MYIYHLLFIYAHTLLVHAYHYWKMVKHARNKIEPKIKLSAKQG